MLFFLENEGYFKNSIIFAPSFRRYIYIYKLIFKL